MARRGALDDDWMLRHPLMDLIYGLQRAISSQDVQQSFMRDIGAIIPASAYGIFHLDPVSGLLRSRATSGVSAAHIEEYECAWRDKDPLLNYARTALKPAHEGVTPIRHGWRRTPYRSYLAREGFEHSMLAPVVVGGKLVATLNFARGSAAPPFATRDLSVLCVIADHVAAVLERAGVPAAESSRFDALSPREREVALLVADGMTNQEIAAASFITVNTVKHHLKRIFEKMDVRCRVELAAMAVEDGLRNS